MSPWVSQYENENDKPIIDIEHADKIFAFSSFNHSAHTTITGTVNQSIGIRNNKSMSMRDSVDITTKYALRTSTGSTKKHRTNFNVISPTVNCRGMSKQKQQMLKARTYGFN